VLYLDHLTVAALTLDEGVEHVRCALGVDIPFGGAHPLMGTHNHLMQLGDGIFLEVIAPDPEVATGRRRWFALDDLAMRKSLERSPRLVTWVVRAADLRFALAKVGSAAGEPVCVSRGTLSWQISVPADGSLPMDGAFPTIIEWPNGAHPSLAMADLGCRLDHLSIAHPDGTDLAMSLAPFFDDRRVVINCACEVRISATIVTPSGARELA
jgi:hypothetical protein